MQSSRIKTTIKQLQLRKEEDDLDYFEKEDFKDKEANKIINDLFDLIEGR